MKVRRLSLLFVALLALCSFAIVQGASVEKLTLSQLAMSAKSIVVGKITNVSYFDAADRSTIYTRITMDVSESLKGTQSGTINFTQLGGVVGDRRVTVSGFPQFVVGQELVLFLNDDPSGTIATVGLGQGKFNVLTDQSTGEKKVVNDVMGLEMINDGSLVTSETISLPLSDLKKAVAEALTPKNENDQK